MKYADMRPAQLAAKMRWIRDHDWGCDAYYDEDVVRALAVIVPNNDNELTFTDHNMLRDWAGY